MEHESDEINFSKPISRKRKQNFPAADSIMSLVNIKRWCEKKDKEDENEREYMADDELDSGDEDARKFAEGIRKKKALKEFNELVKKIKSTKI